MHAPNIHVCARIVKLIISGPLSILILAPKLANANIAIYNFCCYCSVVACCCFLGEGGGGYTVSHICIYIADDKTPYLN